jgi:hypothetical protein
VDGIDMPCGGNTTVDTVQKRKQKKRPKNKITRL